MHKMIAEVQKTERGKKLSYDAIKDVYLLMKISHLEKEVEILKSRTREVIYRGI